MNRTIKALASKTLNPLGMYSSTREVYYRIRYFRSQEDLEIAGIIQKVWSTTFASRKRVKNLSGERDLISRYISLLRPGDIVWDVGANMGVYSLFAAAKVGPAGHVYAFEPERKISSILRRNIDLNCFTNVTPLAIALGDCDGEAILYPSGDPQKDGIHSLVQRNDHKTKEIGYRISIRRGDSLVKESVIAPPNIIKMDIEGAELVALRGMAKTLQTPNLRALLCEVHPRVLPLFGGEANHIEKLITEAKFLVTYRNERGSEYHLVCEK